MNFPSDQGWESEMLGLEDKSDQDLTRAPRQAELKTDSLAACKEFLYRNNLKLALFKPHFIHGESGAALPHMRREATK